MTYGRFVERLVGLILQFEVLKEVTPYIVERTKRLLTE